MAEYLTTDTELTSIADAIRSKGGTSDALTYPTEFIDAINAIETTPATQSKTISPTEAKQTVLPDTDYLLSSVTVNAIPSDYVGSDVPTRSSSNLSVSGAVVSVPSGYYAAAVQTTIASGLAQTPAVTITSTPTITLNSENGLISVNYSGSSSITPTVTTGYISSGMAGTVSISGSSSLQLSTQVAATINPTESEQTAVASGKYTTGIVKVGAIPSDYIGSAIATVAVIEGITTVSGTTATRGDATWSAGLIQAGNMGAATFANSSSGQTQYVDISNTTEAPVLVSGGYLYINKGYTDDLKISLAKLVPDGASADLASDKILSGYAAYNNDGTLIAGNILSKGATIYYTSSSDQVIEYGKYLSGNQTIKAVTTSNISAANIKDGVIVKVGDIGDDDRIVGVTGTFTDASTVTAGQTAAASGQLLQGYSAWVDGAEVKGNIATKTSSNVSASGSTVTIPSGYYATEVTKNVSAGSATTPATTITKNPAISISASGLITAVYSETQSVTPTISSGYISSGTAGTITINGSNTSQLSTQAAAIITPTESEQTAVASGKYTTGIVTVAAISSDYIGSAITTRSSSDLSASGSIVTAPSGYYAAAATKVIDAATCAVQSISLTPNITVDSNGLINVNKQIIQAQYIIKQAGYMDTNELVQFSVVASASSQLATQSATTYTPSSATQTIPSGVYLTGIQTIEPIPISVSGHRLIMPEGLIGV